MPIGDLDRRITILRPVPSRNSLGEDEITWTNLAVVWARVSAGFGAEGRRAGAETQTLTVAFRIRFLAGLTPEHRIVWRERTYDIEAIVEPEGTRNRYLDITAVGREVKSDG